MRINLKIYRIKKQLTQEEFSEKMGYNRATYSSIETGVRNGRPEFWRTLKETYNVPESDMYGLMKNE